MECALCNLVPAGLGPASAVLGAVALGCLVAASAFTLRGFRASLPVWHSRAVAAALAGAAAAASAIVLALLGL